eukprot:XP_001690096.1 predicted protein [Chlamydomonas reinhardtii]
MALGRCRRWLNEWSMAGGLCMTRLMSMRSCATRAGVCSCNSMRARSGRRATSRRQCGDCKAAWVREDIANIAVGGAGISRRVCICTARTRSSSRLGRSTDYHAPRSRCREKA